MAAQLVLPDEIIVEILSMLPAKSLLRWRSVSKYWLNLISSTKFKLMHLRNFNQQNPRYSVRHLDYLASEEWFSLHFDDEAFTLDRNSHVEFPFNITSVILCFRIIGCCNGVVCLCDENGSGSDMVILWNPSIRRKLTLPLPNFKSIKSSFVVLGFGYDKMSDDYKVVRLAYNDYGFTGPRVEVYAVKTGIWRKVMFPHGWRRFYIHYNWTQVFSNGCVHWIASDSNWSHNSIMTFDITTELFGEIPLPVDLVKEHLTTIMVSLVGESLAVTYYNGLINCLVKGKKMASSTYKIWVMKEYNNPTSWTLIYNMHFPDADMGKPLKLRNKGDMIMESRDGNIIVYNCSGYASCICSGHESGWHCRNYVDKYEESLALLDVGHSVSDEEAMKALMMIG
ncbi:hypothetical protein OSB04_013216 [Centaurea solstitialis]|uniref:F-box domain-containing protein n=1 Tax=Centaurea solstitialis TaxID=347529 RepID=A0AA38WFA3_9ASTR|nr:hypothetical protein OSB04_013216 [Centaurea solstitialis]